MAGKFYLLSFITAVLAIILGAITNQLTVGLFIFLMYVPFQTLFGFGIKYPSEQSRIGLWLSQVPSRHTQNYNLEVFNQIREKTLIHCHGSSFVAIIVSTLLMLLAVNDLEVNMTILYMLYFCYLMIAYFGIRHRYRKELLPDYEDYKAAFISDFWGISIVIYTVILCVLLAFIAGLPSPHDPQVGIIMVLVVFTSFFYFHATLQEIKKIKKSTEKTHPWKLSSKLWFSLMLIILLIPIINLIQHFCYRL